MTRVEKKRLKTVLKSKREELIRDIAEGRERLAIDPVSDPIDQVRGIAERDFAVGAIDRMSAMLGLVDDALRDMPAENFGKCAQCGEDIPMKRLEAVPWSPYCLACQERLEQSQGDEQAEFEPPYALAS